jgi:DNA-binding NarL/FixJ family response regulator
MKTEKPITVLLADDHAMVRRNLWQLLKADGHFQVVGQAKNGKEAVMMAKGLQPNVILMDISMPRLNGLEAAKQVLAENPKAKVIMLSAYSEAVYVERARAIGVVGFLNKQMNRGTLAKSVRAIFQGSNFFTKALSVIKVRERNKRIKNSGGEPGLWMESSVQLTIL